jgi:hypothetical protein
MIQPRGIAPRGTAMADREQGKRLGKMNKPKLSTKEKQQKKAAKKAAKTAKGIHPKPLS